MYIPWPPHFSTNIPYTTLFRSGACWQEICIAKKSRASALLRQQCIRINGLSVHADLEIQHRRTARSRAHRRNRRSEEHTSELQSQSNLVCRLLLEKKNNRNKHN